MDRFFEWRDRKDYSQANWDHELIGSMIEYLVENGVNVAESVPWHVPGFLNIDIIYNYLKDTIQKLGE